MADNKELVFIDFGDDFNVSTVETENADVDLVSKDGNSFLRIRTGINGEKAGVTVHAPESVWDLTEWEQVQCDVINSGDSFCMLRCMLDTGGFDVSKHDVTGKIGIKPGHKGMFRIPLSASLKFTDHGKIIGMHGVPVSASQDTSKVTLLEFFVSKPLFRHEVLIGPVRAAGDIKTVSKDDFFPFIDQYGQYVQGEWPGKIKCDDDFRLVRMREKEDLEKNPCPPDRTRFGGWEKGPGLKATGSFRVEKYEDTWWLVDPEGKLFWSHGMNCVDLSEKTPTSDREHYFRDLPSEGEPLGDYYGTDSDAWKGYYKGRGEFRTYDFAKANLFRKYGPDGESVFSDITLQRLLSWGFNTIGDWSDPAVYLKRRVPYTATPLFSPKRLAGSEKMHAGFYDVFDNDFRKELYAGLSEMKDEITDPWCIGFFIDNELGWYHDKHVAEATLASPADQTAKQVFLIELKKKYSDISGLNRVWGTDHASWDTFMKCTDLPDRGSAGKDLADFTARTARVYYRTVRDALREIAPGKLYLGSRLASHNDTVVRIATEYCDVVSFNIYEYSIADLGLCDGIDRPVMIGEFHFGAMDRGSFHYGQRMAKDQEHRAELYDYYVRGALCNRLVVGTHRFKYRDQPCTGREMDEENFQVGVIDICDTPFPEIIKASRAIGSSMYEYRMNSR